MANKFFGDGDNSDSDNDNKFKFSENEGSGSEESSKEDEKQKQVFYESSDESNDDEKRVVKPEKTKRLEGIHKILEAIKNHVKITDFVSLSDDFADLNKEKDKCKEIILTEPNIMKIYIKGLGLIDQCVNSATKETKLKVNAKKSFNALKNNLKKHNKDYEAELKKFQESPESFEIEVKKSDEKEEEKKGNDSSSSEDDVDFSTWKNMTPAERRQRWVKKDVNKASESEDEEESTKKAEKKKEIEEKKDNAPMQAIRKKTDDIDVQSMDEKAIIGYVENVERRITQGKEKDYLLYISDKILGNLQGMYKTARNTRTKEKILLSELLQRSEILHSMKLEQIINQNWHEYCDVLTNFCSIYEVNTIIEPNVVIHMYTYLDSLNNVMNKALQLEEHPSVDYIMLLRYENCLIFTLHKSLELMTKLNASQMYLVAEMYMEHIYFKPNILIKKIIESTSIIKDKDILANEENCLKIKSLYQKVCQSNDNSKSIVSAKAKATLMYVYNLCINSKYNDAKSLFLLSRIAYSVQNFDSTVQLLFNRCIVQLGIAAFKEGDIEECHSILTDLCSHSRFKDLLGQNFSKSDKIDKRESIPLHQHINLDLVESVHLICGMLLEVPNLAKDNIFIQSKVLNKAFRKMLESMQKNVHYFTSESVRESLFYATQSLQQGDWKQCFELIKELSIWDMMEDKTKILDNLLKKIKISGLIAYILDSKQYYNSYSITNLAEMFEVSHEEVRREVVSLLLHKEIIGYVEEETLSITGVESTPTENLISYMFTNAEQLCTNNEKIAEKYHSYKPTLIQSQSKPKEKFFRQTKSKKKP